jgi:hypothetical protein
MKSVIKIEVTIDNDGRIQRVTRENKGRISSDCMSSAAVIAARQLVAITFGLGPICPHCGEQGPWEEPETGNPPFCSKGHQQQ